MQKFAKMNGKKKSQKKKIKKKKKLKIKKKDNKTFGRKFAEIFLLQTNF